MNFSTPDKCGKNARFLLLSILIASMAAGCATHQPLLDIGPEDPPRFEAVLKPLIGENGEVTAIEVDSVIYGGLQEDADRLSLTAPVVYAGAYGIADRVKALTVTDRKGKVLLESRDDPVTPGGFPYFRHWTAQRAVEFPVRVTYHTNVEQPTDRRGPPFNIRPSKGGVSGAGSGFIVIPENAISTLSRVRWDLGEFPVFSTGISSWGTGEFELAGAPAGLYQGWYMAGPLGRYPATGDLDGFSSAWLGDFPFDAKTSMERVGEAYAWLGNYFGYLSPPPRYRVFMRMIQSKQTRFSGTALSGSFMLSGGPNSGEETNNEPPDGTFFHEMIHMWVGGVEAPMGINSWFSEGLTSYYTLVLPLRGGFETVDQYADSLERLTEKYYTSPALNMSAEEIAGVGFGDEDIRSTPYSRGTLYFADLDARIRKASGGERNLDDFMFPIFHQRHSNPDYVFDHSAWIAALSAELGPEASTEFTKRILEGETIVPSSDAFGPCFKRESAAYSTENGEFAGYKWVRRSDVPDDQCADF